MRISVGSTWGIRPIPSPILSTHPWDCGTLEKQTYPFGFQFIKWGRRIDIVQDHAERVAQFSRERLGEEFF